MKRFRLGLILKATLLVFVAFALILGNEIRLGISRYRKNTIETDAEGIVRTLDKFAKEYSEKTIYNNYELSSQEFQDIYSTALSGDSSLIKSLVTSDGKIMDVSRETIPEPTLCMMVDEFETQNKWPENYPVYFYLNCLDEKDIDRLEEYMISDRDMVNATVYATFPKNTDFKNNEFRDVQIQRIMIDDYTIVNHNVPENAIMIKGPLSFYSSQNKEVFFGHNTQMISYGAYSHMAVDNPEAVVIDYRNAIKGVYYQLQKNFEKYTRMDNVFYGTNNAEYYLLQPYRYNGRFYSSVMFPMINMSQYQMIDRTTNTKSEEELKRESIKGYIIVTKEYTHLTSNSMKQFMIDNSSTYLLTLLLISFISLAVAYLIVKPVRRIEISAKHIARKEFDYPIDMSRRDELGDLANSIDTMSKELEKTINHLYQEIEKVKYLENIRKEFVSNFTHEIKTPLGIINGFSELVELEQDEKKRNEYIDIIQNETKKINRLVQAMLDYSRLESKTIVLNLEECDLLDLLEESIDSLHYLIEKKNIQLIQDVQSVHKEVDVFRIGMVFNNFLSNAIRYTNPNGKIYLTLKEDMFSIENEGTTIPEDELKKVWLTFHKVDKSRSEDGTGLGLAICRAVFELHHFGYGVENTEKGVKFYFKFRD